MAKYYATGDAIFSGGYIAAFRISKSQANWVFACFMAALNDLSESSSWITAGETTPDEAAELFESIFYGVSVDIISIGDIKFVAAPPTDAWLLCDGTLYDNTSYQDLFNAIGTTFNQPGDPVGKFRVPDLRGRVVAMTNNGSGRLPSWANSLGGNGGESDHTLTSLEMPAHNHGLNTFDGLAVSPGELPVKIPTIIPTDATANAGGGGSHNNVQPTIVLAAYILARI